MNIDDYETGYKDGESSAHADWYIALSEVLGDNADITPASIAGLLRGALDGSA